jgi:hypothetical protein
LEGGRFRGLITSRDVNEIYRLASSREDLLPELITAPEEAISMQQAPR